MLCWFFRLDEALSQYFGAGAELAQQEAIFPAVPEPVRKCPQCGKDMVLKTRKSGGSVPSCAFPSPPLQPSTGRCAGPILLFPRRYLDAGLLHQPLDGASGLEWWPWGCEALWEWAGGGW